MQESNGEPHDVYNTTTEPSETEEQPEPKGPCCPRVEFAVPTEILSWNRFRIKVVEVFLAFLAFVLEEIVTTCEVCMPLYFFEFAACSAFLFTSLLLFLLATNMHTRVKLTLYGWAKVDFVYTLVWGVMFLSSSMAFAIYNDGTIMEHAAAAFGFLSSMVFFLDFIVLVRTPDHLWRKKAPKEEKEEDEEGAAEGEPEAVPLNSLPMNGNGMGGE